MANVSLTDKASSTTPYVGPERPAVYFDIAYSCNPASLPFLPKSILLENKFLKIFTGLCIFIHQIEYTSTNLYSISTNFKENLSAKTSILAQFRHFIFINPFHTNKKLLNINFPNCTIPTYVGIHRGSGPLSKDMETTKWTVAPLIRDGFSMIGTAVGGTASAFYGFNHAMPVVQRWIKGPMWVHFLVGAPPVIVFSSACAGLAGGAIPALAQLASSAYYASMSSLPSTSSSSDNKIHKSTTL